MVCLEEPNI